MIWFTLFALGVTCWFVTNNNDTHVGQQQCQHVYLRRRNNITDSRSKSSAKSAVITTTSIAAIRAHIRRIP